MTNIADFPRFPDFYKFNRKAAESLYVSILKANVLNITLFFIGIYSFKGSSLGLEPIFYSFPPPFPVESGAVSIGSSRLRNEPDWAMGHFFSGL